MMILTRCFHSPLSLDTRPSLHSAYRRHSAPSRLVQTCVRDQYDNKSCFRPSANLQMIMIEAADRVNTHANLRQPRRYRRKKAHSIQTRMHAQSDLLARENGFQTQSVHGLLICDQSPPFAFAEKHFERVRSDPVQESSV